MSAAVGEGQRRQREFVANVSHDLRTPLTAIRGFAGALLDGTARTEPDRRHAAETIDSAAARMDALVNTLIDMARLEGGKVALDLQPLAVSALLDDVVTAARPEADQRQIALTVEAAPGLAILADAGWLARAVGNVVDNALRYSPNGGTVSLAAQPGSPGEVRIEVRDHGSGIAAEDLPHVFERFYRGDRARVAGGSGLGLAIAREIVIEHGGEITLDSRPGQGTTATFVLPRAAERRG
jgi:two-component system sensor histidine kinase ResE